jgi:trans-2-enoyl-CoA reductase
MRYMLHTLLATAVALTLALAQPAAATQQKKGKSASSRTLTGCLAKGTEANTYVLNNIENGPKTVEIIGAPSGIDLNAHVGHKVTITGATVGEKAAANAEAKAADKKKPTQKEIKEEAGEHHMRITSLKMVSTSCP